MPITWLYFTRYGFLQLIPPPIDTRPVVRDNPYRVCYYFTRESIVEDTVMTKRNNSAVSNTIYSLISKANSAAKSAYFFDSKQDAPNMNYYRGRAIALLDAAQDLAHETGANIAALYNECMNNNAKEWYIIPSGDDIASTMFLVRLHY